MPQATVDKIFRRGSGHPDNIKKMARTVGLKLKDIIVEPRERTA